MGAIAYQITSFTIVYNTQLFIQKQMKEYIKALRWPVNSPHKWLVTRKMFPFDDGIMQGFDVSVLRFGCSIPVQ